MNSRELPGLNVLRVLASLYMVMFHFSPIMLPQWVQTFFARGAADTDLFFLLSGYLLAHLSLGRPLAGQEQSRFIWRRLARIVPVNLLSVLLFLLVNKFHLPAFADGHTVLLSLLMIQSWVVGGSHTMTIVAWSLSCLLFFYLLFPLLLPALERRRTPVLLGLLLGLWLLGAFVLPELRRWPGPFLLSTWTVYLHNSPLMRLPEFVLGMGAAVLVRRSGPPPVWLIWGALPLVTALMLWSGGESMPINNGVFAPLALLLLLAFLNPGRAVERLGASRLVRQLADASICIYLFQMLFRKLIGEWVLTPLHLSWNLWTMLGYLGVLILAAVAADRWLCRPATALLLRRSAVTVKPAQSAPLRVPPLPSVQPLVPDQVVLRLARPDEAAEILLAR